MYQNTLSWAQRLRGELAGRIEELRAALADIEPLRQELTRLESQMIGVERLIAVCHDRLGNAPPQQSAQASADRIQSSEPSYAQIAGPAAHRFETPPPWIVDHISNQPIQPPGPHSKGILRAMARLRNRAEHLIGSGYANAARAWLSLRAWLSKNFERYLA
jgi:hypothetical protein